MKYRWLRWSLCIGALALTPVKSEAVSVGLLGGINLPTPSSSGAVGASTTTDLGFGGGFRLGFPLGPMWGFSVKEFLETWKMGSAASSAATVLTGGLGPTFSFSKVVALNFGVSYSFQLTKPANQVPQAFGIYVGLPVNIDVGGNTSLTFLPEYSFGISSLVTGANGSLMPHLFRFMAGVTFGTGGMGGGGGGKRGR